MEAKPLTSRRLRRWLRSVEPRPRIRSASSTPRLLMVNGRKDLPIPLACRERTGGRSGGVRGGGRSDRFRFVVIDQGHVMGPSGRTSDAVARSVALSRRQRRRAAPSARRSPCVPSSTTSPSDPSRMNVAPSSRTARPSAA
jgi:hypothetical protein